MPNLEPCCYCGEQAGVTKDHIPPKNLFSKPRPSNLITVPACKKCHSKTWSKDDEYFRLKVCLSSEAGGHPEAQKAADKALRSLQRPEASGFRAQFRKDTFKTWIRSPNGLSIREALAYQVDQDRIYSTIARVTRGLYYHESGERLANDDGLVIYSDFSLQDYPRVLLQRLINEIVTPLAALPAKTIGADVFSYRSFFRREKQITNSAWGFTFYLGMSFLALTRSQVK